MKRKLLRTDESLLKIIGDRLARLRLAKNLTQEQLAEQAGVGLRTIQRLELGSAAIQLSGFFRLCRALDLGERLDAFIPDSPISPLAQLRLQGKKRRRASGRKATASAAKKWKWGEPS